MDDLIRRGLVALSADPVTNGHLDLIARAAEKCRELVVLVAENERKKATYTYTLAERTAMTERAVTDAGITNARFIGSSGLLVDVYLREGCDRLFRGVRDDKDLDYEEEQAELNAMILPALRGRIEYLKAKPELKLVSSTTVKIFADLYLDTDKFVPMFVKRSLEERRLGQYRIAVTGGISVGKSWVAAELARQANAAGIRAMHLNVDALLRSVYDEDSPGAQDVRDELFAMYGHQALSADRKAVDRKWLAARLFGDDYEAEAERRHITKLTMPHVARMYRDALRGVKGLVIVEWAQLAEMGMGPWTNNNVIVVGSVHRATFASRRGITEERLEQLDAIQWSALAKAAALGERAARDKSGTVLAHDNVLRDSEDAARADVAPLFQKVRTLFPDLPAAPPPSGPPRC